MYLHIHNKTFMQFTTLRQNLKKKQMSQVFGKKLIDEVAMRLCHFET